MKAQVAWEARPVLLVDPKKWTSSCHEGLLPLQASEGEGPCSQRRVSGNMKSVDLPRHHQGLNVPVVLLHRTERPESD